MSALAASAVLFYAAVSNMNLTYAVLGLLILALVYLLYRFNERRLEEVVQRKPNGASTRKRWRPST